MDSISRYRGAPDRAKPPHGRIAPVRSSSLSSVIRIAHQPPPLAGAVACIALGLAAPTAARAHEIPSSVTVRAFVKPEGTLLRFLVRVPLEAMRDFEFPTRGPGYLDLKAAEPLLHRAATQWLADYVAFYEAGTRLPAPRLAAIRVSLPSDPSFRDYDDALAHLTGPLLPEETTLPWRQALLDVWFEYPIAAATSDFSIRPAFAHLGLRTLTVLRFLPSGKPERAFEYLGDPGLVRLDPRWHQAVRRFIELGFHHILSGFDHLLFLLALVIPFRRVWSLVPIVTAFTVAHSITLIASTAGLAPSSLWFPPLIEVLIAGSVVFMAIGNIVGAKSDRRWMVAFGFGLVHGFGFSFALRETLQFAGSHLVTSLLSFNLGVEVGQLLVVAVAVPVLNVLLRRVVAERIGIVIISVLVGHTAWHWMTERRAVLIQYRFAWPAIDAAGLAALLRWLMLLALIGGAAWLLREIFGRIAERVGRQASSPGAPGSDLASSGGTS